MKSPNANASSGNKGKTKVSLREFLQTTLGVNVISLERLPDALHNFAFKCCTPERNYFVKVYRHSTLEMIQKINGFTLQMQHHGVPVPRIAVSKGIPDKVVIHHFIDGEAFQSSAAEIRSAAEVFSTIMSVGMDQRTDIPVDKYLQGLHTLLADYSRVKNDGLIVDHSLFMTMRSSLKMLLEKLAPNLPAVIRHQPVHADFNERNLLFRDEKVVLVCDWESYRLRSRNEHIAVTIDRFCTDRPLQGKLDWNKVETYISALAPSARPSDDDGKYFSVQFPYLATLQHLRLFIYRHEMIKHAQRHDMIESMLIWPTEHCRLLLKNAEEASHRMQEVLETVPATL